MYWLRSQISKVKINARGERVLLYNIIYNIILFSSKSGPLNRCRLVLDSNAIDVRDGYFCPHYTVKWSPQS